MPFIEREVINGWIKLLQWCDTVPIYLLILRKLCDIKLNYKQFLDEVFVISGIINVHVRAGSHFDISISISRHTQTQYNVDN